MKEERSLSLEEVEEEINPKAQKTTPRPQLVGN